MASSEKRPSLLARLQFAYTRKSAQLKKYRWQKRNTDQSVTKTPIFIFGNHRSGTKMVIRTLNQSDQVWIHVHGHLEPVYFFRNDLAYTGGKYYWSFQGRLVPLARLNKVIKASPAPFVAFHGPADSQCADSWLQGLPNLKIIWIFRSYKDTATSVVTKFGSHQKDVIRDFANGKLNHWGWRSECVDEEIIEICKTHYREDMTDVEAAVLFWFIRNQWFFKLGLDQIDRTNLVKYEDLVTNPTNAFQKCFQFVGIPSKPEYVKHIHSKSRDKPFPAIDPKLQQLADDLTQKLDAAYRGQSSNH